MQNVEPLNLHTVADFAVKAGAFLLASGAAAAEVVAAMLAVAQQAGIENVSVDVTYSELTFSYRPDHGAPYTRIQTIHQRTFNYGKLTDVSHLVERFCQGQLTMSEADAGLSSIATSPGPYPWWLTRLAAGFAEGAQPSSSVAAGWSCWRRLLPTLCWIICSACSLGTTGSLSICRRPPGSSRCLPRWSSTSSIPASIPPASWSP
jgi:hypothetical protein